MQTQIAIKIMFLQFYKSFAIRKGAEGANVVGMKRERKKRNLKELKCVEKSFWESIQWLTEVKHEESVCVL